MRRTVLLPAPLLALTLAGCLPELPEEKSAVEGEAAGDCTDRADNDRDGAFDCDDDGCAASPDCTAPAAPPEGLAIAVTPAAPGDDDALSCTIVTPAVDPNGDAVQYAWAWSVDGEDAGNTGEGVAPGVTVPGQSWTCTVTPSDGVLTGTPASATVSIQRANGAPSAPVVAITPEAPTDEDALGCAVVEESVDPDGDAVTYAWAWSVDGVDAGIADPSVDASRTRAGETWTCSVTASDGSASSAAGTARTTVTEACVPALDFAGSGYAVLPRYAAFSFGTSRSFSLWVYPRSTGHAIFGNGYSGSYCGSMGMNIHDSGRMFTMAYGGDGGNYCTPGTGSVLGPAVTLNDWQHVVVVVDASDLLFYVDGVLALGTSIDVVDPYAAIQDLWLGVDANLAVTPMFDGAVADLAFWNRALTSDEVTRVRATDPGAVSGGLVGWWPMNEGVGSTLGDSSGVGLAGTIHGAVWTQRCADGTTGR